jgi:hypothetical protein
MLTIHDEQLAQQLQEIAEREHRPVEDVLKSMVARYSAKERPEPIPQDTTDSVTRIRHNAYAKARQYWQSIGDKSKATMTDAELNEQFGAFDEEGIPRLKSELSPEPPVGSLAYAAKIIRERGGVDLESAVDATKTDDILNDEFADYLLKRMRGEDATE